MKRFTARILAVAIIAILCTSMIPVCSQAITLPKAFFDLEFDKNGVPYDAAGNYSVTVCGGSVKDTDVKIGDKSYTVTGYYADKAAEYLELGLTNTTLIPSVEAWGKLINSGFTMEVYMQIDKDVTVEVPLFASCYSGGVALYDFKGTHAFFHIGSNGGTDAGATKGNSNYAWAGSGSADESKFNYGEMVHLVGVYDQKTNMIRLFINGKLAQEGSYGTADFKIGKAYYDVLGIGLNPSYPAEEIGSKSPYTVLEAKLYNTALTDTEIAGAYEDLTNKVTSGQAKIKVEETTVEVTTVEVTTAAETAPVTEAPVETEATDVATEAPATQAPETKAAEKKSGCGSAVGSAILAMILPALVFVKRKKQD